MEISAIKFNRYLELGKLIAAVIAALAFLGAFALNRYAVHDERLIERRLDLIRAFDDLYTRTLQITGKDKSRYYFTRAAAKRMKEDASNLRTKLESADNSTESKELIVMLNEAEHSASLLYSQMPEEYDVDRWIGALDLEEEWKALTEYPRADFHELFGRTLDADWQNVQNTAISTISSKFGFLSDGDLEKRKRFRDAADAFRRRLGEHIR